MVLQVADAFIKLIVDEGALKKAVNADTGPAGAAAEKSGQTVGKRFSGAFQKATTAAGAAAGAVFVGAIGGAVNFEDQLRTINTVAHLTDAELTGVGKSILDLSKETGKGTDDLTQGFYDLVSAGIPAADAINVLRDSAKVAVGGLGTTGEAVDLVTSALNAYGLKATQSSDVTDIFAQAVADGKVTIAELGASVATIAPIAASAGISLEEVGASFALLTAKGVPAAQAATQMRAAISALLTPNETLNQLQKETHINFAKLAKEKGLAVALEELRKATHGNNEEFAKSLGSVEAYGFALASTGENAGAYATELGKVQTAAEDGGVAQGQYDERMKSAKSQGDKALASIKAFGIELGGPFVGTLGPAVAVLGQFGQGLGGIFSVSKLVGGGIGALIGKLVGVLIPGILGTAIPAGVAGEAVGVATAGGITLGMVLLPALLIAAVIAAIVYLVNNPEIVGQIATFVGSILANIATFLGTLPTVFGNAFQAAIDWVGQLIPKLPGMILDAVIAMAGFILTLPFRIADLGVKILEKFWAIAAGAVTAMLGMVPKLVGIILTIPGRIAALQAQLVQFFREVGANILKGIGTLVDNVVKFLMALPGRIASLGGAIVKSIIDGLASLPGKIWDVITKAFRDLKIDIGPFHISASGVTIDLPQFAQGSPFVPDDMVAVVHRGEIIVPARESAAIRGGQAILGQAILGPGASSVPSVAGRAAPGGETHIHVEVAGLLRARNPREIGDVLRRLGDFGVLPPRDPGTDW